MHSDNRDGYEHIGNQRNIILSFYDKIKDKIINFEKYLFNFIPVALQSRTQSEIMSAKSKSAAVSHPVFMSMTSHKPVHAKGLN